MAKPMTSGQSASLWLAHIMSLVSLILVLYWIYGNSGNSYFLGGTSWTGTELFNLHPLFMVSGMVVAFTQQLLAYRTYPFSKSVAKAMHGLWASVAVLFVCLGLYAVFKSNNDSLYGNLYTTHSWVGIAVVTLFFAQYLSGIIAFGFQLVSLEARKAYMPRHIFLGTFVYIGAAFTCMLGIQDENSNLGCGYSITLTSPDYNPAAHYSDIYEGCRVSNGLAIAILCTCLLATYATFDLGAAAAPSPETSDKNAPLLAQTGLLSA